MILFDSNYYITMNRGKKLEVNYRAYTLHLIRNKLPYLIIGFTVFFVALLFIFKRFIISAKPLPKRAQKTTISALKKYTVLEGEDLWQIAEKEYGSGFNAYDIAKANNINDPYILQAGQVLVIPNVKKRFPTHGELTPEAASTSQVTITGSTYTVQQGDYLFQIAARVYGDGNMMWKLIEANKIPEPYDIEAGQILQIPR